MNAVGHCRPTVRRGRSAPATTRARSPRSPGAGSRVLRSRSERHPQYGWFVRVLLPGVRGSSGGGLRDQPPLSSGCWPCGTKLFGESLVAIRLMPAMIGAACVFLAGSSHRLGRRPLGAASRGVRDSGRRSLGTHHLYSMNTFDVLLWMLAMRSVFAALEDPSRWPVAGVCSPRTAQQISVLWLGRAGGVCSSPRAAAYCSRGGRGSRRMRWFSPPPHVVWQVQNGWPTLEFIRNAPVTR